MIKNLPRLLIISEITLSKEGMGANRTLLNLFDSYQAKNLMLFTPENFLKSQPTAPPFDRQVVSAPSDYLPTLKNRIGVLINRWIQVINLQLLDWLPIPNQKKLEMFAPEVILICPITPWGLLMGHKLTQHFQCPSLIYMMDDWLANVNYQWFSSNIHTVAKQLLQNTAGWLMISEQLKENLLQRYEVIPARSLIVHNPVDLSGKPNPADLPERQGRFRVAYAGSIFFIHYDALAAVAEAIFNLRREGYDIELVLYTDESFWFQYQQQWQKWQVAYGGFIPYDQLYDCLVQADLLLIASSFLPENAAVIRSSLLTKLTDYMAIGRPVLSCGPDYSACSQFIKKWGCGIVCESNQIQDIQQSCQEQINNRQPNQELAIKAFNIVKNNFDKHKVSFDLYYFINAC